MEKKRPHLETKTLQMTKLTSKGIHIAKVGNHQHTNMLTKSEIVRRGGYECRILEMNLQLRDQKLKMILYIYRLRYQNFMGIASPSHNKLTNKRNKRYPNWKRRGKTVTLCRWHDTICRKP